MAPSPDQHGGRGKEPSLYEVLSITPQSLQGQDPPVAAKAVKQAYRRALLKHHPDKHPQQQQARPGDGNGAAAAAAATKTSTSSSSSSQATTSSSSSSGATYTVDQITHAYTVLSDAKQRREYTRSLRTPTSVTAAGAGARSYEFQTGVETADLDDLAFDERRGLYHRSCRCGQARGYCFREQDLDDVAEHGELMVECVGCSLWLRVLFEEVTDDEEDDDAAAAAPKPAAKFAPADAATARSTTTTGRPAERTVSSGSHEGKTGR